MAGKKREVLVVASKVKELVKSQKCQSSGDLMEGLSEKVRALVEAAAKRAKANKRATVRPYDL
jgi:hypothetical protein